MDTGEIVGLEEEINLEDISHLGDSELKHYISILDNDRRRTSEEELALLPYLVHEQNTRILNKLLLEIERERVRQDTLAAQIELKRITLMNRNSEIELGKLTHEIDVKQEREKLSFFDWCRRRWHE